MMLVPVIFIMFTFTVFNYLARKLHNFRVEPIVIEVGVDAILDFFRLPARDAFGRNCVLHAVVNVVANLYSPPGAVLQHVQPSCSESAVSSGSAAHNVSFMSGTISNQRSLVIIVPRFIAISSARCAIG